MELARPGIDVSGADCSSVKFLINSTLLRSPESMDEHYERWSTLVFPEKHRFERGRETLEFQI